MGHKENLLEQQFARLCCAKHGQIIFARGLDIHVGLDRGWGGLGVKLDPQGHSVLRARLQYLTLFDLFCLKILQYSTSALDKG